MKTESRWLNILGQVHIVLHWSWERSEEEAQRKDGAPFTKTINRLTLQTETHAFTVWDGDGRKHGFPSFIHAFSPDVEAGVARDGDARPVNVFWNVEGKGTLCGYSGGIAYLLTRKLTPAERENKMADKPKSDSKKKRTASRRNGKKGGRLPIEPERVNEAVRDILKRMRDNSSLQMATACRSQLKETPLPVGAARLAQLVRAKRRKASGRN